MYFWSDDVIGFEHPSQDTDREYVLQHYQLNIDNLNKR